MDEAAARQQTKDNQELHQPRLPRLTFDTNCIVSLLGRDETPPEEFAALYQIQRWHEEGRVRIWISEKTRTESLSRTDTLSRLQEYPVAQSRWILGVSRLGIDTVLASDEQATDYSEMTRVVLPGQPLATRNLGDVFDMAILFEHYLQQNDLFVTRDGRLLRPAVRAKLRQRFGIRATDPIEAVTVLRLEYGLD